MWLEMAELTENLDVVVCGVGGLGVKYVCN